MKKITNISKGTIIVTNYSVANTFLKRLIGLLAHSEMPKDYGLVIVPCNSIHMFFMRFSIDAIFIDKNSTVIFCAHNLKPWSHTKMIKNAHAVIELPNGTIERTRTSIGDKIGYTDKMEV